MTDHLVRPRASFGREAGPATAERVMERRAVEVRGIVQGVGFRPFVYALATRHRLAGFVWNQAGRVVIEVEGEPPALDRFLAELADRPPPLARIERLTWEPRPVRGDGPFRIAASEAGGTEAVSVPPDAAVCPDCLAELPDPADRRFGYPFLNCTNCGPRLMVITGAPYDLGRTTMADFPMCAACRAGYDDPTNRRFHAQPTACAACGSRPALLDAVGRPAPTSDPLGEFARALLAGQIGALKGLGGYHLACDAWSVTAVAELRRRKHPADNATSRFARMYCDRSGTRLLGVQHHHAHMAGCMAENGLSEPVIGVTFDGTGYGTDGAVWGGEFLVGDYHSGRRAARLRYVGMPGGEMAIREPWRMAAAHLADAEGDFGLLRARCLQPELAVIRTLLDRRINTPPTSSVGRLFDTVASLAGVRDRVSYEGQGRGGVGSPGRWHPAGHGLSVRHRVGIRR